MASASDELLAMYKDYDKEVQNRQPVEAPSLDHPFWGKEDTVEQNTWEWPAQPANSTGTMLVSQLLKCNATRLPGPDFEMPVFSEETSWSAKAITHIPDLNDDDIKNYVIPIEAGYWFCYGLRLNKPVFLSGVKGCGKSALPKRIAGILNWPFLRKQMAKDLDSSEFFGQWIAKNGSTEFVQGDLPQAATLGMIFMVDEISNAPPELHPALHQCLEKGGKIYLNSKDGDIEDKIILPEPTFRMVATDNTRGQGDSRGHYAGTDVMNSATMDRFRVMIVMDYMSKAQERKVLKTTVPGVNDKLASMLIEVATKVRTAYSAGDISETLSMRPMIEWAEKVVLTHNIMKSLEVTFLNKIESDSERQEIQSYVQAIFGSLLND